MKYLLMMNFEIGSWKANSAGTWRPEDVAKNQAFLAEFRQRLAHSGELVASEALAGPEAIRIVKGDDQGRPVVSDGPFPETKEFLGGYWMVDVETEARAFALAAEASLMPGPGGLASYLPIEVRPVLWSLADE